MAEFSPSEYKIGRAILSTFDQTKREDISGNFILRFNITQSMDSVSWSGSIDVADATGFLEKFPLRAEEKLELWLVGLDNPDKIYKLFCRIHSITNISPSDNSNMVNYTMNFISETSFGASIRKITAPYRSSISGIAKEIFKQHFSPTGESDFLDPNDKTKTLPLGTERLPLLIDGERNFFVSPTAGISKIIIPDLSPSEAMFFLASRGYQPESPSNTFRFFETLENYYFCTDEYFLKGLKQKDIVKLFYAPKVDLTAENADAQVNRIESLSILSKGLNTGQDIYNGAYTNEVMEIDLLRRNINIQRFNFNQAQYIDMTGKPKDINSNPHTDAFRSATFTRENAKRFMLFKTYQRSGDIPSSLHMNKHIPEIVSNRVSYHHHLNATALAIGMKGRLDLRPGQVVDLDIKNLSQAEAGKIEINNSLAGRYLIQTTNHSGEGNVLSTMLRLIKFDWSSGNEGSQDQAMPEGT